MSDSISMWTVYDKSEDFPHNYVARRLDLTLGVSQTGNACYPTLALRESMTRIELHTGDVRAC
jgi:hypothetical protein